MYRQLKRFFNEFIGEYPILFFATLIIIIVIIGTFCFHFVEKRDVFHSFYFTTVTMATVGYWDMAPLTYGGKVLSIIYWFMWAPLFIGLTWVILQSKFQKLIKHSIHAYHKEVKEAEELVLENQKAIKKEQKDIEEIHEEVVA